MKKDVFNKNSVYCAAEYNLIYIYSPLKPHFTMKKVFTHVLVSLFVMSSAGAAMANDRVITTSTGRVPHVTMKTSSVGQRNAPLSRGGMQITDLETQVYGRYYCEYYSPLIWDVTNEPFGWCVEQPMIVENYFKVEEGDVNIGYLFFVKAILKGHVDMANGTFTIPIPAKKVLTYYEDPDNYDDPGMPVFFVTVDKIDGKYVANYTRPFTGTFELHDGVITKITTDDRWGYVVKDNQGNEVGWFEIAENSTFYLGHGEMEYELSGGEDAATTEQTVIHAVSDGKTATVYNAFRTGWNNPIKIDIDGAEMQATMRDQSVTWNGNAATLADDSYSTVFSGRIRDVDWDLDKRDENAKSVLDFGTVHVYDNSAGVSLAKFDNARFFFKNDVTTNVSGIDDVEVEIPEDAPVEYFNLQGMPVAHPAPGMLLIKRQGQVVSKVVL